MSSLPAGTVTFLFSDIEGSTRLLQELGDDYAQVVDDHRRIMRGVMEGHGGTEIDTQGDAFFFSFTRAKDAADAAVEAQRELAEHEWPVGAQVRVRMGLHTGEPQVGEHGYLGIDVVRAARICSAGHGGQILLSETTRALLGNALAARRERARPRAAEPEGHPARADIPARARRAAGARRAPLKTRRRCAELARAADLELRRAADRGRDEQDRDRASASSRLPRAAGGGGRGERPLDKIPPSGI